MRPQLKIDLQKFYPIDTEEDFRVSNDAVGANTQVHCTFETRVPHQRMHSDVKTLTRNVVARAETESLLSH